MSRGEGGALEVGWARGLLGANLRCPHVEIPSVYDSQVSGADQAGECPSRAEQNLVDDLFRRTDLSVAVMPGHLHELEDTGHQAHRLIVAAKDSEHARLPLIESFSAADRHFRIMPAAKDYSPGRVCGNVP